MKRKIGAKNYVEKIEKAYFTAGDAQLPNSIPSIGGFVGREDYLADLRDSYQKGARSFVLHGAGGVGKTALALQFAAEIAGGYEARVYVEMNGMSERPLTARDAMFAVVRQFERDISADTTDAQLENLFVQFAQAQPTLILLDNASGKETVESLKQAKACFIVTSRQSFALTGGKSLTILKMSPEDARKLLFEIAPEPRFDNRADELASLAGYLPMALKPLASILAEDELETAADLINRYRDKQTLFKERVPDYDDLTVEASFGLSYDKLSGETKERWRRLSVFPADFDETAIGAVLEISEDEARRTQKELRRFSLLEVNTETKRFSLHDLIRVFTDAKLAAAERLQAQFLHAAYYLSVVQTAKQIKLSDRENGLIDALHLIDAEWKNILSGRNWTSENIETDNIIAETCCGYASAFFELRLRLHIREYIKWQSAAFRAAQKLDNKYFQSGALGSLGLAHDHLGEYPRAIEYFEQALEISRQSGNRWSEASNLGNLGVTYANLGNHQKALTYQEKSLEISRELGNRIGEANSLSGLGNIYHELGEFTKANDYHQQSLAIAREVGDLLGEGICLINLGNVRNKLNDLQGAIDYYEQSLAIARQVGSLIDEAANLENIGKTSNLLGEREKACGFMKEALAIYEAIESPRAGEIRRLIEESC